MTTPHTMVERDELYRQWRRGWADGHHALLHNDSRAEPIAYRLGLLQGRAAFEVYAKELKANWDSVESLQTYAFEEGVP